MRLHAAALLAALAAASCASTPDEPPQPRLAQTYADYLVGRTAELSENHAVAADRYFAALTRRPGDQALVEGALTASLALGDVERARRAAGMATGDDAPAAAHLVRAADALAASNWRRASEELDRTEGSAAEELLARTMHIWASTGRRRLDDALLQLEPLASVRPYGGLFAYQQGMALDLAGRQQEALAAYELAARSGMVMPQSVMRHAELLLRLNRRDDATAVLRTAFEASRDPGLAAALARVQAGGQAAPQPLTPAQGAAEGVYGMGEIFLQEHDTQSGMVALALAQMLDPNQDAARLAFAEAQADLGRENEARRALSRITSASPYYSNARVMEAWLLLDAGQQQEAVAVVQRAAESGDVRARRALADMYVQLDRFTEAEPIYSDLIAQDDQNWRLYYARAAARDRIERWSDAEADLQRALQLSPQQPEVLNYLGYSWIDRGENVREGMAMIERAVALRPDSGAILDSLGWGYYRLHDFDTAVQHLERAVELEPADPTLNDHLGDVYWRLGRRIEARYQWRRALTFSPDNPRAIEAKLTNGLPPLPPSPRARR